MNVMNWEKKRKKRNEICDGRYSEVKNKDYVKKDEYNCYQGSDLEREIEA